MNNAGIVETLPVDFVTSEKLGKIFDVNTCAPVLLFEEFFSRGKLKAGGSVVFVSSIDGKENFSAGNSMYAASKSAVSEFVKYAALKASGKNIRVNSVSPGMTKTNLLRGNKILNPEILENDAKKYPLGRYALPEEIASGIVYLLSNASSYVTGFDLIIDGGITLRH